MIEFLYFFPKLFKIFLQRFLGSHFKNVMKYDILYIFSIRIYIYFIICDVWLRSRVSPGILKRKKNPIEISKNLNKKARYTK